MNTNTIYDLSKFQWLLSEVINPEELKEALNELRIDYLELSLSAEIDGNMEKRQYAHQNVLNFSVYLEYLIDCLEFTKDNHK